MPIEKTCVLAQNFCVPVHHLTLDDFDHRLLDLLQQDSGRTLTALGESVGLSASAVQRRITRYREHNLLREVAVLNPAEFPSVTLTTVWVAMERESAKRHAAFRTRMRQANEVQQCYTLTGEWDYLVILAVTSVGHFREVAERLFSDEGTIKRYETRMIFDVVKYGLQLPTRPATKKRR